MLIGNSSEQQCTLGQEIDVAGAGLVVVIAAQGRIVIAERDHVERAGVVLDTGFGVVHPPGRTIRIDPYVGIQRVHGP